MTRVLGELGEDKLLAQVFPRLNRNSRVVIGAGDDCAVVKFRGAKDWLLLKTDCVVEEVHFTKETNARAVGWKAMMRALSDFAAMSGIPEFAIITLAVAAFDRQFPMAKITNCFSRSRRASANGCKQDGRKSFPSSRLLGLAA